LNIKTSVVLFYGHHINKIYTYPLLFILLYYIGEQIWKKEPQNVALDIQNGSWLNWNMYRNVTRLNRLIRFQPSREDYSIWGFFRSPGRITPHGVSSDLPGGLLHMGFLQISHAAT
jgi:hypothetical protein